MTVLDLDRLRARLVEANLGHHADALLDLIEPSVRLVSEPMSERDAAATGTTRLGGEPDLPDAAAWPSFRDMPHSFIAQINLADVSGLAGTNELPDDGLLSFFFDGDQRVWGFDPKDRGGWSVMFTPPEASLRRRRFPASLPEGGRFAARALRPRVELTRAPWESFDVRALGLSLAQALAYADALPADDHQGTVHRLRGHPDMIQGDMQVECQLASNGLYCGDATGSADPRADTLRADAGSWRLLLQIDSDDDARIMWGDVGRIYYWLRRDDLAARRFEGAWCILQCS